MKKRIAGLLLVLCLIFVCLCVPVFGESVSSLDIDVKLLPDGSAQITETWQINATSGTEWYLNKDNMNGMEITSLSVTDETGASYTFLEEWDTGKSLEEKAGKCGIVKTSRGYELCWGLGSYGDHTFTAQYTMTNVVTGYSDYDAFNVRFLNDETSAMPRQVTLALTAPQALTTDNTRVWAFGFDGEIYVENGRVSAWSNSSLNSNNHITVMLAFNKGIFTPTVTTGDAFEKTLLPQALEGSDYNEKEAPLWQKIIMGIVIATGLGALILLFCKISENTTSEKRYPIACKNADYAREIPCGDNKLLVYKLCNLTDNPASRDDYISACMLSWLQQGYLQLQVEKSTTFFGNEKEKAALEIRQETPPLNEVDRALYNMLKEAAARGGDVAVLTEKEFEKWSEKNADRFNTWETEFNALATKQLEINHLATITPRTLRPKLQELNELGMQQARDVVGFKHYLLDFTIINERKAQDVQLWDSYLVYAALYGIADEVAEQFAALYPAKYAMDSQTTDAYTMYYMMHMSRRMSAASSRGISAAARASGGGGSASFGGGGGFSGGGSGGGSR